MIRRRVTRVVAVVLSLAATAVAPSANADENAGPYVELLGGLSRPASVNDSSTVLPNGITSTTPTTTGFKAAFDKGPLFGGAVGYAVGAARIELQGDHLTDTIQSPAAAMLGGDKISASTALINAWFDIGHFSLRPYLGVGAGAIFEKIGSNDKAEGAVHLGGGINGYLTRHWTLDLGYRYLTTGRFRYSVDGDDIASGFHDHQFLLGVRFNFFGEAPPPAPPVDVIPVAAAPVDSDGDGVFDDRDQCPNTPPGTAVNEVGCPLPPPCRTPDAGQAVDLSGCATGDTLVLRGVNFDFDKATLTANAKTLLDGVADALVAAAAVHVEIGGHTDSKGSPGYNRLLSERRAASVVQYLVGRGIDAGRLSAHGYGETQPIADNATDEGRELNRRVELTILTASAGDRPAAAPPSTDAVVAPAP